jgi:hypothetical protein
MDGSHCGTRPTGEKVCIVHRMDKDVSNNYIVLNRDDNADQVDVHPFDGDVWAPTSRSGTGEHVGDDLGEQLGCRSVPPSPFVFLVSKGELTAFSAPLRNITH